MELGSGLPQSFDTCRLTSAACRDIRAYRLSRCTLFPFLRRRTSDTFGLTCTMLAVCQHQHGLSSSRRHRRQSSCRYAGDSSCRRLGVSTVHVSAQPHVSGEDVGPLCGLPLAVKDSQDVFGLPTSASTPALIGSCPWPAACCLQSQLGPATMLTLPCRCYATVNSSFPPAVDGGKWCLPASCPASLMHDLACTVYEQYCVAGVILGKTALHELRC